MPARVPEPNYGPGPRPNGRPIERVEPPTGSWHAEADLDKWLAAKKTRDFKIADDIRDNLRRQGIDPEKHRGIGHIPVIPPSGSAATEAMLDDWVEAKRAKDYPTADRIRSELKDLGIHTDEHRPPPGGRR